MISGQCPVCTEGPTVHNTVTELDADLIITMLPTPPYPYTQHLKLLTIISCSYQMSSAEITEQEKLQQLSRSPTNQQRQTRENCDNIQSECNTATPAATVCTSRAEVVFFRFKNIGLTVLMHHLPPSLIT